MGASQLISWGASQGFLLAVVCPRALRAQQHFVNSLLPVQQA